jgi:basic membrane protein A
MPPSRLRYAVALLAMAAALAAGLVGCASGGLKVGLAFGVGGPGDDGFNDSALAGLNRADRELPEVTSVRALAARADETPEDQYQRLVLLCQAGFDPVIAVGYTYAGGPPAGSPLARAVRTCPKTRFAIVDDDTVLAPTVANLVFAEEQGAYLMGVVAADKTTSGRVGLVGACPLPLIDRFRAGYAAGVAATKPQVKVDVAYAGTDVEHCDFTDPAPVRTAAEGLYTGGADVVFQVAGGAGTGVFEAADPLGKLAIGVDTDQWVTAEPSLRHVIVTSMIKNVGTAVYNFVRDVAADRFVAGVRRYDLADGGIDYATSGGQIDALVPALNADRAAIESGRIVVPTS